MTNLLSLDAFQLAKYVANRFNRKLIKSDLNEIRDLSFQILGNKEAFNSDSKSLLKIYYTLVRAYHNGILGNEINKTFPYRHNFYVHYINNRSNPVNGSSDANISNDGNTRESVANPRDDSDRVVDSCCEYLNKNVNKIITNSFKSDFIETFNNYLNNVKDDKAILLKLCVKLLIEFWTKNTLDDGMVILIKDELKLNLDKITRILSDISNHFCKNNTTNNNSISNDADNNDNVNSTDSTYTNKSVIDINNVIDSYLLLILTQSHNEDVIYGFVKVVNDNFNHVTPQQKLRVFYGLSSLPESELVNRLLSRFLVYFYRNVNVLQLSDVTLLVNSYGKLQYQNRVLDKLVELHLIPKFNNITILDLFILLDSFIDLDYRCSLFTKNIDNEYLSGLKKEDETILMNKLQRLHSNTTSS